MGIVFKYFMSLGNERIIGGYFTVERIRMYNLEWRGVFFLDKEVYSDYFAKLLNLDVEPSVASLKK